MIISHSNNFIFLKTPKTAGTSIQNALMKSCNSSDIVTYGLKDVISGKKSELEEFSTKEDIEKTGVDFESFFSFGFTRNPFDLVLSRYFYQIKRGRISVYRRFNTWIKLDYFKSGDYKSDRTRYFLFDKGLQPQVDFIGRFENLSGDFQGISRALKLKHTKLLPLNKSNYSKMHYTAWYNANSRELVEKYFDFELYYFKYNF